MYNKSNIVYADTILVFNYITYQFIKSQNIIIYQIIIIHNIIIFIGIGNSLGRKFNIKLYLCHSKKYINTSTNNNNKNDKHKHNNKSIICAITIYQVVDNIYEPINNINKPLICISAISNSYIMLNNLI